MSDDRELSPQQEEHVRRLLAEARVDEPMPGDVAGRLDRVLTRLADGDLDQDPAQTDELATRRRRRLTTLLVAAAAVVAVGVGVEILDRDVNGSDADSAASESVPAPAAEQQDGGARSGVEETAPTEAPAAVPDLSSSAGLGALRDARPTRIRPTFFAIDVERVRSSAAAGIEASRDPSADAATADSCEPGAWGSGDLYLVRYAGNPAVLAFRPVVGETQVVDLMQCGSADILRSVTLPGR